jgi:hypothetical protein
MVGALMGAVYLFDELRKEKLLAKALKPAAIGFGIMTAIPLLAVIGIVFYFKPDENPLLNPQFTSSAWLWVPLAAPLAY